ncbi:MAG: DNA-directed RNA polymerase subunit beta [Bradymonadales bacterium]|nr:DNA-directed RNA polymerase subunit beta [Bradymonadales bacterium]
MASVVQTNFRLRKNYGKTEQIVSIPNLIGIQKRSYEQFLQSEVSPEERADIGLQAVFKSVFPIKDFNETSSLEFVEYRLDKPKYDVEECLQRGMTFAAPIKVVIRLVVWDVNEETQLRSIRDVKEQEVFFGEIPLMTEHGTFIINGTERVVVSQLHRSPGAFFDHDKGKTHSSGKLLYSARVIPYRGSWLDFEFDAKDILHCRIDRRRKMPATILLRALGYSTEQLLEYYYDSEIIYLRRDGDQVLYEKEFEPATLAGQIATVPICHPETGKVLVKQYKKITKAMAAKLKLAKVDRIPVTEADVVGRVAVRDIYDPETGEILIECNEEISEGALQDLVHRGIESIALVLVHGSPSGPSIRDTLALDKITSPDEAILEIYQRLRPGDPPTLDQATQLFNNLFFNPERYDLSKVGRLKLNHKFALNLPLDEAVLTRADIMETVRYLVELRTRNGPIDDIDHLGNRRVRAVGELLENQYRIGLVRMERAIKERMSMAQDLERQMPHDLINAKPVTAVVREYFGSSQLSQFMDQTNPLSEITHKRRLSALGPGGLTRERAGFEVRDVHPTHYGRICPIETPEGPNIGLIASLATFARVNEYGFIESPYRVVKDGKVTGDVSFFSALEEEGHVIAQANTRYDRKNGKILEEMVICRKGGEPAMLSGKECTLMDVSPNQLVSVAASLIPFLENDDANRALMGSNMQRQAVPLLRTCAPLVGTGVERIVARDSGVTVVSNRAGVVESVDASRIVIRCEGEGEEITAKPDIYNLIKYQRSNQNTCINQKPIVSVGEQVNRGDVIADGPATDRGELALGQNLLVAFMPWHGYNFEDSILISERVVRDDTFTSIHIEEFECIARDTKLGPEEITRDIPNVGEEALANLDESGIIRIGAEVNPGDILVGKITPKGETQFSPEENLLRAIFGEKAGDVRDSSLRVPPGVSGTVINAKVFSRKGTEKDERTRQIEQEEEARLLKDQNDQIKIIRDVVYRQIGRLLVGQELATSLVDQRKNVLVAKGVVLTDELLEQIPRRHWKDLALEGAAEIEAKIRDSLSYLDDQIQGIRLATSERISKIQKGDELPPGVIKMVKVYVAIKRKLQVGDKMAGRHGNKGVLSIILPEQDMPYLEDGTPVDIVLNPLGVPSRMNVGQVLETHLGGAAYQLGLAVYGLIQVGKRQEARALLKKVFDKPEFSSQLDMLDDEDVERMVATMKGGIYVASPVFDGAKEEEIRDLLKLAGLPLDGKVTLYDGRTGQPFENRVTVGLMYMLKLHHLVDDKIHARSIGPYSLVTQQPLGGKAQFGGQRLGEMEVWAMEAYGAAYALQEFLTVKSDDVSGRTRIYESIVKGDYQLDAGLPESFNVLIKEMHSLGLNVELMEEAG